MESENQKLNAEPQNWQGHIEPDVSQSINHGTIKLPKSNPNVFSTKQ